MELNDKTIIVTGGAAGIGRSLCERFAREGPRGIVVADLDGRGAAEVADAIGGLAATVDVSVEAQIVDLVARTEAHYGPVDLFFSNAGIAVEGGAEVPDADWQRIWGVNVMAHVYAARAVIPGMLERGGGTFASTASAAGLLSQIGSAPYAVTKHAAVAFAEWLSITYGNAGLRVCCLCPQGVFTEMLDRHASAAFLRHDAVTPEAVADCVVEGLRDERFLILPHPEVAEYMVARATDRDRWIAAMRRLQERVRQG